MERISRDKSGSLVTEGNRRVDRRYGTGMTPVQSEHHLPPRPSALRFLGFQGHKTKIHLERSNLKTGGGVERRRGGVLKRKFKDRAPGSGSGKDSEE